MFRPPDTAHDPAVGRCRAVSEHGKESHTDGASIPTMSAFKGSLFSDRQSTSANAKKALLEKFKAKPAPDDPAVLARAAERRAIAEAREVRAAERRAAKEAEAVRLAAEQAARDIEAQKRLAEEAARAAEQAARDLALKAERQAARDARYAARKARR